MIDHRKQLASILQITDS